MDIISKKWIYFLISGLIIVPGIISLILYGLRFSIEFTGGTVLEVRIKNPQKNFDSEDLKKTAEGRGVEIASLQKTVEGTYVIGTKPIDNNKSSMIREAVSKQTGGLVTEERFETVGPVIGREMAQKAILAIIVASAAIVFYIAWAFNKVPKPASPWRFGITAIIAMLHDAVVVVGIFSLLGHFYKVEIDTLFVTALLTIIGFSVHDTIVVFDRIRENLRLMAGKPFGIIVNESIIQTLARSLSTSLTVIFTLIALLLFSAGSIRWFIIALLIGIISGTYSSIFNASPLLVVWQEWSDRRSHIRNFSK